jgi:hypothetical protein
MNMIGLKRYSIVSFGVIAVVVIAVAGVFLFPRAVLADDYNCTGSVGAVTIGDNLRVPDNATCTLNGTRVEGNIRVESNATLQATNVFVDGNVQAENAAQVNVLDGSQVEGSVQIVQSGGARVENSAIDSDLYYDENTQSLTAIGNTIGGNLQAFQNTGGVLVRGNVIDGNLQCKENVPAPTGSNNTVHGNAEDQCENLTEADDGGDTYTCTGPVSEAVFTNVRVPDNATCALGHSRVEGSLTVEENATLRAMTVQVAGNIEAAKANKVDVLDDSAVGGSVRIVQSDEARIQKVAIDGDLDLRENQGLVMVYENRIGGSLLVQQNAGDVALRDNTITGDLACQDNTSALVGSNNIVEGSTVDQCQNLPAVAAERMLHLPALMR